MATTAASPHQNAPSAFTNTTVSVDMQEDFTINSRAYQLEMLGESLKGNVIVVMNTGTGKTHVAVLRIKKELETSPAGKRVWFLAPTKELCYQQYSVLHSQISSVQIKLFTSDDNVARWTAKENWDAVLTNVNIIVSTYGVLHEALSNGVVDISSLSLIVFDEAHNCVGNSPGSKIMKDFYFLRKEANLPVPHILGLTPSAVIGRKLNALENLEKILDSSCRSPRIEKQELLSFSNRPKVTRVEFEGHGDNKDSLRRTDVMESLIVMHESLDINDDPEILRLRTIDTEASRNKMDRKLMKKNTFIQEQMKSFRRRSDELCRTLGIWAADFYISQVISTFIQSADSRDIGLLDWEDSEKQYLANALRPLDVAPQTLSGLSEPAISRKVRALLNFLSSCDTTIVGVIFVKERAIAYMLHRLLCIHPDSHQKLRCEALVGTSQRPRGRRDVCDLPSNVNALEEFRSGQINILIATSVLEEGIDVPQCDLVICFDEPANLKSYIQCRGRARSPGSQWVVMIDTNSNSQVEKFEQRETEMESRYQEEGRNIRSLAGSESSEIEQCLSRQFRVESTDALLDMENAKGRLQFFCSQLSSHYSVNLRPEYIITEEKDNDGRPRERPLLSAKVVLPPTLESSLRVGRSKLSWLSEKNATKDAAFEAYLALYRAGLVNEFLLPLNFEEPSRYMETMEAIVEVQEQYNPWPRVAVAWKQKEKLQRREVTLRDQCDVIKCKVELFIPANLTDVTLIPIYWNASTELKIEVGPPTVVQPSELTADHTEKLLQIAYGHRWEVSEMKHVVRFNVENADIIDLQLRGASINPQVCVNDSIGPFKSSQERGYLFSFLSWLWSDPAVEPIKGYDESDESSTEDQFFVVPDRWIRRTDFLHPVAPDTRLEKQKGLDVASQSSSTTDTSMTHFHFGRLIPSILHKLEVQLVVEQLCTTVLADVQLPSRELIRTAISTPVAREQDNYQKLEFLGDSVLKFLVSVFVSSNHANWPEGYLSGKKDSIVSNSRLCRAAIDRGFGKFILTNVFTGRKWRPLYIDNLLNSEEDETRNISSKTVADVAESLIGAGWKMGGYSTSLSIVKVILPEVDLPSLETGRARLFDLAPASSQLPANLHYLETLAGYSFKKKSLLIEAMSHSSDTTAVASYERIEFLGDAILEVVIVNELMMYEKELSNSLMHLYKTALVNNDYLGFVALEWSITQKKTDLEEDIKSGKQREVESEFALPLWRFMKHGMYGVGLEQREIEHRHASLRHDIQDAISTGREYPWSLLARIHAKKFYADIVESLLGAVWVDSGSFDECKNVLRRMGILPYLHRIIQDRVHVLHPREELSILADGKQVDYKVQVQKLDEGSEGWTCTVSVDETLVSEVVNGVSELEVRTSAAKRAVSKLRYANGRSGSPVAYGGRSSQCRQG